MPSTYGTPWPDPQHLSISFVPDGTQDGSQTSTLYQTMGTSNTNAWQLAILRAFQTWTNYANVNISLTGDSGAPFGTPGSLQEDPRFGDIRIGATPQSSVTAALTQEFEYGAGTWAGDVNFNSLDSFALNSASNSGSYDLFTMALHEAGHALGLPDNNDPTSVMYTYYNGPHTGLSAADISAIQAIYGPRTANGFSGATGNNSIATAATITPVNLLGTNGASTNVTVSANIDTPQTVNYYKVTVPSLVPYVVQLNTSGLSSFQGQLTIYNSAGQAINTATATDPRNGNLSITLPSSFFPTTYYISVRGATSDVFGIGSYMLRVAPPTALVSTLLTWTNDTVIGGLLNVDLGLNSTPATATNLLTSGTQSGPATYTIRGSVSFPGDTHDFSIVTPTSPTPVTMTASVWGITLTGVDAGITVYNSLGQVVPANIIQHAGNTFVVQIPNATPGARYDLVVGSYNPNNLTLLGNYELAVSFGATPEAQSVLSSGTLSPPADGPFSTSSSSMSSLSLDHDTLFNFVLASSSDTTFNPGVELVMTITDQYGNVVRQLMAQPNQAQSLAIWLGAGTYTISVQAVSYFGYPVSPINWTLSGETLSDPMGTVIRGNSSNTTTKTN